MNIVRKYYWLSEMGDQRFFNFLQMKGIEVLLYEDSDIVVLGFNSEDQMLWFEIGAKHFYKRTPEPFYTEG